MKGYTFAPFFPMAEPNNTPTGNHRTDLPNDADVHFYDGQYWTLEELYTYGALPPVEPESVVAKNVFENNCWKKLHQ